MLQKYVFFADSACLQKTYKKKGKKNEFWGMPNEKSQ